MLEVDLKLFQNVPKCTSVHSFFKNVSGGGMPPDPPRIDRSRLRTRVGFSPPYKNHPFSNPRSATVNVLECHTYVIRVPEPYYTIYCGMCWNGVHCYMHVRVHVRTPQRSGWDAGWDGGHTNMGAFANSLERG